MSIPAAVLAESRGADAAEPEGYSPLIDDAIREYRAHNFEEARALFRRANELYANARALRGIGMAAFELRDYVDSLLHLRAALESDVKPLNQALRDETEALASRAATFVAQLQVRVQPESAEVSLDGALVTLPSDGLLLLSVGEHVLEFRATGFASERRHYKVRGGEREVMGIELKRAEAPPAVAAAAPIVVNLPAVPQRDEGERRPLYKNPWLWTGVAVAVAGLGVGLGLGLKPERDTTVIADAFKERNVK